jgi:hypothetical protein
LVCLEENEWKIFAPELHNKKQQKHSFDAFFAISHPSLTFTFINSGTDRVLQIHLTKLIDSIQACFFFEFP